MCACVITNTYLCAGKRKAREVETDFKDTALLGHAPPASAQPPQPAAAAAAGGGTDAAAPTDSTPEAAADDKDT